MKFRPEVPALLIGLSMVGAFVVLQASPIAGMALVILQLLLLLWVFQVAENAVIAESARVSGSRRALSGARYAGYEDLFRKRLEAIAQGGSRDEAATPERAQVIPLTRRRPRRD